MKCQITNTQLIETYARSPVRMWTVPYDDCVAFPTPVFYRNRMVTFSNEGNAIFPKWVALDRYNDEDWTSHDYETRDLSLLYDRVIGSAEGLSLGQEPTVWLAPPVRGATLLARLVYRLSNIF